MSGDGIRIALAGAEAGVEPAWIAGKAGGAAALARMSRRDLARLGVPRDFAAALARARGTDIAGYRRELAERGIRCTGIDDPGYPPRLRELSDPPVAVFQRGTADIADDVRRVAIVGSRQPSDAGLALTRRLARFAAAGGVPVVSGIALGIDAAAHAGALEGGGPTVAVLGCGVDVVYPRTNAGLFSRVLECGVVVSEYPPGTPPAPWRFPARNRLIAALAETLLVVEARASSGALITADRALDLGRDVLAVPGSPSSSGAAGTNGLLKAGAGLIEDAADLAGWLGLAPPGEHATAVPPELAGVLAELGRQPAGPDQLAERLGRPAADIAAALIRLELDGLVIRDASGVLLPASRPAPSAG